jgi:hypothetical protein
MPLLKRVTSQFTVIHSVVSMDTPITRRAPSPPAALPWPPWVPRHVPFQLHPALAPRVVGPAKPVTTVGVVPLMIAMLRHVREGADDGLQLVVVVVPLQQVRLTVAARNAVRKNDDNVAGRDEKNCCRP